MRAQPDPDAAGDVATTNAFSQFLRENHLAPF
jgi:hypothetical protein